MRTIALTAALPLMLSLFANAAEPQESENGAEAIKSFCKAEWESDYRMVKHCIERQSQAAVSVGALWNSYGDNDEEREIINRCFEEWMDAQGRPDWRMVEHCSERQIEAYEAIQ